MRFVTVWLGRYDADWCGLAGLVRSGTARCRSVRYGSAGMVRHGKLRCGFVWQVWFVTFWCVRAGRVRCGLFRSGAARSGRFRQVWCGLFRRGLVRYRPVWQS